MRKTIFFFWLSLALVILVSPSVAQENPLRDGDNPFEEEFDYRVGEDLEFNVQIDGLVWRLMRIDGGDSADFVSGKDVRTQVGLEAENQTDGTLALDVILLLEDARGNQLERIELKSFKVPGGRTKQVTQKIKIDGGVLTEMGKIYVFAEVS